MNLELCEKLAEKIKSAYESGITTSEAERLAGEFLHAQMLLTQELQDADLNARMRKTGLKAIRASIYMREATKTDKKPSDVMLVAQVDMDETVKEQQNDFDQVEGHREAIQNYFNIFKEAHVFFRGVSRGRYE